MTLPALLAVAVAIAIAVSAAACSRREPITSCEQSLEGAWQSDHGTGERWMILESKGALEAYPLFPDGRLPGVSADLETAPRVIDLSRAPGGVAGDVKRRFMRRGVACVSTASVHVIACANDVLELVLADPPVPAGFDPCSFPRPDSSRRERWRRE